MTSYGQMKLTDNCVLIYRLSSHIAVIVITAPRDMYHIRRISPQNVALAHGYKKGELRRHGYVLHVRNPQIDDSTLRRAASDGLHGFEGKKLSWCPKLELDLRMGSCEEETDAKLPEAGDSANADCSA